MGSLSPIETIKITGPLSEILAIHRGDHFARSLSGNLAAHRGNHLIGSSRGILSTHRGDHFIGSSRESLPSIEEIISMDPQERYFSPIHVINLKDI